MVTKSRLKSNFDFEPGHPLHQLSKFRYLPLIVVVLLLSILLATCNNTKALQMVVENQPYIYVQNLDGTTIQAKPSDPLLRSDPVIAKFVQNWLKLAYGWKAPPDKGKAFISERGVDFPYQFYLASLAIKPEYREAYLDLTAKKYETKFPFSNYITGQFQSYVRIYEPDLPKIVLVEKGIWDVTIVAIRTHAVGDSILAQEVFNHVIRVRAIKPSNEDEELWGNTDSHLGILLNEMQHDGLQIIQINEF